MTGDPKPETIYRFLTSQKEFFFELYAQKKNIFQKLIRSLIPNTAVIAASLILLSAYSFISSYTLPVIYICLLMTFAASACVIYTAYTIYKIAIVD